MTFLKSLWSWVSGLVGNNPKVRWLILLFVLLLLAGIRYARADEIHLETGVSALHGYGPYLSLVYRFNPPLAPSGISFETGLQMWGQTTPYEGQNVPNNWAPFTGMNAAVGPVAIGLGLAYLQRTDVLDGTHTNLALKLAWEPRWGLFSGIVIRHISNAGTSDHNIGRNAIAIDWRLR